jgi:hypothetical protein
VGKRKVSGSVIIHQYGRGGPAPAISVTASRARHQAERAAEQQVQQHFRKQHDDDEPGVPLPPSKRGVYRRRDMRAEK